MNLTNERVVEHNKISEFGGDLYSQIEVKGTSYNANDTSPGYIEYIDAAGNKIEMATAGRGLTLFILKHSDLTKAITTVPQTYDVYANDSHRDNLAVMLNNIHNGNYGNVIYCLASFDAIGTNTALGIAMETARANHWFTAEPGSKNGPRHRHPYAAIGTSRLGIIKEMAHTNAVGADAAYVSMSVSSNWDAIGAEGYGPDLLYGAQMKEVSYTGTGYSFNSHPIFKNISANSTLYDGEWLKLTGQAKIDLTRFELGGSVASYIYESNWSQSSQTSSYSIEWETFHLFFKYNAANANSTINVTHYQMPNSIDGGTCYIKNVQVQKCGFDPDLLHLDVALNNDVLAARTIAEGIGFELGNEDSYLKLWNSNKNLTGRPNLGDSRLGLGFDTNSVRWFNKTLTERNQYSIHEGKNLTSDSNRYNDVGYVNIDSSKMYVGLIWMYVDEKYSGQNYFGTHTRSNGSQVPTYSYTGTYGTTNPYSQYPHAANIEKKKWSLMSYWFLPHWFTDTQGIAFYEANWSRAFGNYENGSADNLTKTAGSVKDNEGNIRVSRFKEGDDQIHLRWLDYYNGTRSHKTWWALPGIYEVDPMGIQNTGLLFPGNVKEV